MTGKNILILVLVLVLIFIIYLIFSKKSSTSTEDQTKNDSSNIFSNITQTVTNTVSGSFPLKKGSFGKNVTTLQNYLNSKGATLVPDGAFGNLTLAALQKYTGLSEVSESYFNTYVLTGTTATSNLVGKSAYAGGNGCSIYATDYKTYNNFYRKALAGEFMGIVSKVNSAKGLYELGSDKVAAIACSSLRNT